MTELQCFALGLISGILFSVAIFSFSYAMIMKFLNER